MARKWITAAVGGLGCLAVLAQLAIYFAMIAGVVWVVKWVWLS